MARYTATTKIEATASIQFSEAELRALDAIISYGHKAFEEAFYREMGRAYLEPHAAGLKSLFATLGPPIGTALRDVDDARKFVEAGYADRKAEG